MLVLPATLRVLLYREPVDMSRSFGGLECLVRDGLGEDPLSGSLFDFSNKRRDQANLLLWDGSGFWIWYKRLEEGTFHFPAESGEIGAADLVLVLEGIDLSKAQGLFASGGDSCRR